MSDGMMRLVKNTAPLPEGTERAGVASIEGVGVTIVALKSGMPPQVWVPALQSWHDFDPDAGGNNAGLVLPNGKAN